MATINPIRLFGTISRFEGGEGDAPVIVYGPCYKNAAPGDGFDLPFEVIKRMAPGYEAFSNVREMHQPVAVGTSTIEIDDANQEILMRAEIVDDEAKKKVMSGVYKGFSVGIKPTKVKRGAGVTTVIDGIWYETSLVDRPADPGSVFSISRIEGEECEVEEVEGEETPAEGAPADEAPEEMKRMIEAKDSEIEVLQRLAGEKDAEITRLAGEVESSGAEITRLSGTITEKDAEIQRHMARIEELEKQPDPAQAKPMMVTQEKILKRIAENYKAEPTGADQVEALMERSKTATTDEERAEIMRDLTALRAKGVSV
jgi:hypothetical protein